MPFERPFWSLEEKGNFELTGASCIDLNTQEVLIEERLIRKRWCSHCLVEQVPEWLQRIEKLNTNNALVLIMCIPAKKRGRKCVFHF